MLICGAILAAAVYKHDNALAESKGKETAIKACRSISVDAARESGTVVAAAKIVAAGQLLGDPHVVDIGKELARRVDQYTNKQATVLLNKNDTANVHMSHADHNAPDNIDNYDLSIYSKENMLLSDTKMAQIISTCKAHVKVAKHNEPLIAIIDTGASKSAITKDALRRLGMFKHVEPVHSFYFNADGRKTPSLGRIKQVPVTLGRLTTKVSFSVTDALTYDNLLGMDFLKASGAILDLRADSIRYDLGQDLEGVSPLNCHVQTPMTEDEVNTMLEELLADETMCTAPPKAKNPDTATAVTLRYDAALESNSDDTVIDIITTSAAADIVDTTAADCINTATDNAVPEYMFDQMILEEEEPPCLEEEPSCLEEGPPLLEEEPPCLEEESPCLEEPLPFLERSEPFLEDTSLLWDPFPSGGEVPNLLGPWNSDLSGIFQQSEIFGMSTGTLWDAHLAYNYGTDTASADQLCFSPTPVPYSPVTPAESEEGMPTQEFDWGEPSSMFDFLTEAISPPAILPDPINSSWDNPVQIGGKSVSIGITIKTAYGHLDGDDMTSIASAIYSKITEVGQNLYLQMGLDSGRGLFMDLQTTPGLSVLEVSQVLPNLQQLLFSPSSHPRPDLAHFGIPPLIQYWGPELSYTEHPVPRDPRLPAYQVQLIVTKLNPDQLPSQRALKPTISWSGCYVLSLNWVSPPDTSITAPVSFPVLPLSPDTMVTQPMPMQAPEPAPVEPSNSAGMKRSPAFLGKEGGSGTSLAGVPLRFEELPFPLSPEWIQLMHDHVIPYVKRFPLMDIPLQPEVVARGLLFTFWAMLLRCMYQVGHNGIWPSELLTQVCRNFNLEHNQQGVATFIQQYVATVRRHIGQQLLNSEINITTQGMEEIAAEYLLSVSDLVQGCDEVVQSEARSNKYPPYAQKSSCLPAAVLPLQTDLVHYFDTPAGDQMSTGIGDGLVTPEVAEVADPEDLDGQEWDYPDSDSIPGLGSEEEEDYEYGSPPRGSMWDYSDEGDSSSESSVGNDSDDGGDIEDLGNTGPDQGIDGVGADGLPVNRNYWGCYWGLTDMNTPHDWRLPYPMRGRPGSVIKPALYSIS
jgi:hypothetical protein